MAKDKDLEEQVLEFTQTLREASERQRNLAVDLYPYSGDKKVYDAKNALIKAAEAGDKLADVWSKEAKERLANRKK